MGRLSERIAIITGGAQGIGLATARRFAEEGARVIIWDVNTHRGEAVAAELREANLAVDFRRVDVTDVDDVTAAAQEAIDHHRRIDILVNNAGITRDARLVKMTPEEWQQVLDVNLTGVFYCTRAVAPYMMEQQYGRILNASSVVGLYGNFGQTNYVATKAGVIGMTRVWARELGRYGITVNAVAPGFIATEMVTTVPEKVISALKEKTPLQRLGKPEEVASAYLFLASEEAAFITGAVLSVDGGLTI
ncbi:MAG: 3-oxoacyl-ACP reductase FabG [Calditrichaeota bacterium]|nr:MAG: 3-oxoacyl-ACP reductase FabG [Calditrichota bacterium]